MAEKGNLLYSTSKRGHLRKINMRFKFKKGRTGVVGKKYACY
jgi:hypothetical protein